MSNDDITMVEWHNCMLPNVKHRERKEDERIFRVCNYEMNKKTTN